jgi:hypothetical protein
MRIINLFAGPGAGKSTTAAGLFHEMKLRGEQVELVLEYAKDLTYEKRFDTLANQIYVFGKQLQRIHRLYDNDLDWVITDSPLLLSILFRPDGYPQSFTDLVIDIWDSHENLNFYIERYKPYVAIGRTQSELEAIELDDKCLDILDRFSVDFTKVLGDKHVVSNILKTVKDKYG